MRKPEPFYKAVIGIFLWVAIVFSIVWVVGSVVVSGVKSFKGECGLVYDIEEASFLSASGDWFCPSE